MITAKPKPVVNLSGSMITIIVSSLFSFYLFKNHDLSGVEWVVLSCFWLFWFLIEYFGNLFYPNINKQLNGRVSNHIIGYIFFIVLLVLFYMFFPEAVPNKNGEIAFLVGFPVLAFNINYFVVKLKKQSSKTRENTKYTLVAGTGYAAKNVEDQIYSNRVPGHQIKGFVNCRRNEVCAVEKEKVVSDLKDIHQYLETNPVDEIVIASPGKLTSSQIQTILSEADYHGIRVKYILDYHEIFGRNYKITHYGQIDAVNIRQLPSDGMYPSFIKSCFDKIFSALVLIFLAPLFLIITILIKMDSPGPVFYCPIRIGRSGKPFKVYKFRSMRENDASSGGVMSTKKDDPRITKLGKALRKYSLDELPQFINVFLGEMSVVGPRPHRRFLNQQLQVSESNYMVRHYVKPGITGWAQVNGWRGPTDTVEQKKQRTTHDLWYIENWSFLLDLKIIYRTLFSRKVHDTAF